MNFVILPRGLRVPLLSATSEALLERLAREFVSREEIACGVGVAEGSELSSGDLPGPG